MDNLSYTYTGNQLQSVAETGSNTNGFTTGGGSGSYAYNDNGNMKSDPYKGIDLLYNELNLVKEVKYDATNKANYYYTATGGKLRMKVQEGGTSKKIDYVGSFVYINNTLSYIATSFGRILKLSGSGFEYEYHAKDHLGNVRVAYRDNGGNVDIVQLNNYYPFGLKMDEGLENNDNKYMFNGKEDQDYFNNHKLNWYDYGWRQYDPILGRWHAKDPMNQFYSPYIYCANNPINMIDPTGMWGRSKQDVTERPYEHPDGSNGGGDPSEPQPVYSDFNFGHYADPANRYRAPELGPTYEERLLMEALEEIYGEGNVSFANGYIKLREYHYSAYGHMDSEGLINYVKTAEWHVTKMIKINDLQTISDDGEESNWLGMVPAALSMAIDIDLVVGTGADITPIGGGKILQGKDKGKWFTYHDGGEVFKTYGVNLSIGLEEYNWYYTGDIENFSIETFNGERNELEIGYGPGGTGITWTKLDKYGGRLIGIKGEISTPSPISIYGLTINYNYGETWVH